MCYIMHVEEKKISKRSNYKEVRETGDFKIDEKYYPDNSEAQSNMDTRSNITARSLRDKKSTMDEKSVMGKSNSVITSASKPKRSNSQLGSRIKEKSVIGGAKWMP